MILFLEEESGQRDADVVGAGAVGVTVLAEVLTGLFYGKNLTETYIRVNSYIIVKLTLYAFVNRKNFYTASGSSGFLSGWCLTDICLYFFLISLTVASMPISRIS